MASHLILDDTGTMTETEKAKALAIIDAFKRLDAFEPLIAQRTDGSLIAVYLDENGNLCHECIHPRAPGAPARGLRH